MAKTFRVIEGRTQAQEHAEAPEPRKYTESKKHTLSMLGEPVSLYDEPSFEAVRDNLRV